MGFAISWLAVSGKDPQRIYEQLGLRPNGGTEEIPESDLVSASLPQGWFLIFANEFDSPLVSEQSLSALSAGCCVVSCQVEEHVVYSSAVRYENGRLEWRIEHDAQEGMYDLRTTGNAPPGFEDLYANLRIKQNVAGGEKADVDFIHEVPISLAHTITSFRHDMDIPGASNEPFLVLVPTGGKWDTNPKSWRQFW